MGGTIFIESDDAEFVGVPVGAQHLYLVHRDTDGHEYVIRSGPSSSLWPFGTEMKVEANVPIERSEDARGDESPADRASTLLDFPDLTTDAAWAIMVKYARLIAAADYPYHLLQENSNAFIGAMLAAAGGDPDELLPKGVDADEAVGFSSFGEILDDIAPPPDGTLYGTEFADLLQGIQVGERIVAGGGDDIVRAGRGDDYVVGGAGNDGLNGGGGADTMNGGAGNDTYYVDNIGDVIIEASTGGTSDWVATSISYALSTSAYVERLSTTSSAGTTAINLTGNGIAQTIIGNAGNNRLKGGGGADTMNGGAGNDTYYVDNTGDMIGEASTGGTLDWVATSISYALSSSAYVERLSTTSSAGTTAINLTGNGIAQTVIGNAGNNILSGKGGNDILTGSAGSDTFQFNTALSASSNVDKVTDYNVAADTMRLENAIFTTLTAAGALSSGTFASNSTGLAGDSSDRIVQEKDTGELYYDANGIAAGGGIHFATLTANLSLTNADFLIV